MVGLDTGFFIRILENNKQAVLVWEGIIGGEEASVSCLTLFELRRLSLRGALDIQAVDTLLEAILSICNVTWVDAQETIVMAANLSHGLGIPAVDAFILAGFLMARAKTIYTTDSHLEGFKRRGIKTIKL